MPRLKKRPWPQHGLFVCEGLLLYNICHTYCCTKGAAAPNPLQDPSWPHRDRGMLTSSDHLSVVAWSFITSIDTHIPIFYLCTTTSTHQGTTASFSPNQTSLGKVVSDLFEFKGKQYLLVVDYYSRYPEVIQLIYCNHLLSSPAELLMGQ